VPEPCPACESERLVRIKKIAEREGIEKQRVEEERLAAIRERMDHPEKLLRSIGVGKRHESCSFENYKGGEKIKEICENFLSNSFDLIFSGGSGTGKTHLASAILRELVKSGKVSGWRSSGIFKSVPELLAEIRATYRNNSGDDEKTLIEEYSDTQYLVLDDFGAEKTTEWSISTLYLIIDRRYRECLPTIITTNLTLDEIAEKFDQRIASRLSSARIITIKGADYRAKKGPIL